ncbi:MAG TPA: sigma-70 family RNA polymerase sigma factor [Fimbriiglobus sp.]|nr:sigma-70 family RNA polymerase sigma factor [Fimbriiglobus sp.]
MGHTSELNDLLGRLRRGDPEARSRVVEHACERVRKLARKMLRAYPSVRRWSETDDVLQNALLRLHRALAEVRPESVRQFYGLAATQIRRELLDLAKHFHGTQGHGAHHHSDGGRRAERQTDDPLEPETLEAWTRFHEQVDRLPDEEREVVQLLWYEGLRQPEAAVVLGVSLATLKRRWQAARLRLSELLEDWSVE